MRRALPVVAVLLALLTTGNSLAEGAKPKQIKEFLVVPLPTFEAADLGSTRKDLDKAELAALPTPCPILDQSDNGMYLIELDGHRFWVLDTTVKVDAAATGSALAPGIMNFNDKDLAGSRGYGD